MFVRLSGGNRWLSSAGRRGELGRAGTWQPACPLPATGRALVLGAQVWERWRWPGMEWGSDVRGAVKSPGVTAVPCAPQLSSSGLQLSPERKERITHLSQAELLSYKHPDRSCTPGLHGPGFFPAQCLCVGTFPGLQCCLLLSEVLVTVLQGGCCCLQWGSRGVLPLPQHPTLHVGQAGRFGAFAPSQLSSGAGGQRAQDIYLSVHQWQLLPRLWRLAGCWLV